MDREGQGFSKPPGYGEGYRRGRGQGTDFVTLHKPLPVAGVSGVSGVSEGYWCSVKLVALCVDVRWGRGLREQGQDCDMIAIEYILILRTRLPCSCIPCLNNRAAPLPIPYRGNETTYTPWPSTVVTCIQPLDVTGVTCVCRPCMVPLWWTSSLRRVVVLSSVSLSLWSSP